MTYVVDYSIMTYVVDYSCMTYVVDYSINRHFFFKKSVSFEKKCQDIFQCVCAGEREREKVCVCVMLVRGA